MDDDDDVILEIVRVRKFHFQFYVISVCFRSQQKNNNNQRICGEKWERVHIEWMMGVCVFINAQCEWKLKVC